MVSMSEYKVMQNPSVLSSVGLGSCIALVLYDVRKKIGGLAHIMLPSLQMAKDKSKPTKFADSCVHLLLGKMEAMGASRLYIRAKIFGGANMFPSVPMKSFLMNVGERNAEVVRTELKKKKIRIVAEEVGGHFGRTVFFDLKDGSVRVRDIFGKERVY